MLTGYERLWYDYILPAVFWLAAACAVSLAAYGVLPAIGVPLPTKQGVTKAWEDFNKSAPVPVYKPKVINLPKGHRIVNSGFAAVHVHGYWWVATRNDQEPDVVYLQRYSDTGIFCDELLFKEGDGR